MWKYFPLPYFLTVPLATFTLSAFYYVAFVSDWRLGWVIEISVFSILFYLSFVSAHNFPLSTWFYRPRYSLKDVPNLKNRVFIVTGANAGLGKSSAKALYQSGAHVVLAVRSLSKGREAVKDILDEVPKSEGFLEVDELNLSSLASVAAFAKRFKQTHERLDCLMLNAGIMACPFTETEDGIESQFGVNHVAHHFLATELLDVLKKTAPSRIVVLASSAHQGASSKGVALTLAEINDRASYKQMVAYGQSKLANILFGRELDRRVFADNIFVNIVHPGAVATELLRNVEVQVPRLSKIIQRASKLLFFDPDTAALTQLYAATSPAIFDSKIHGKYFVPLAREHYFLHHQATDDAHGKKLWDFTESLLREKGFR